MRCHALGCNAMRGSNSRTCPACNAGRNPNGAAAMRKRAASFARSHSPAALHPVPDTPPGAALSNTTNPPNPITPVADAAGASASGRYPFTDIAAARRRVAAHAARARSLSRSPTLRPDTRPTDNPDDESDSNSDLVINRAAPANPATDGRALTPGPVFAQAQDSDVAGGCSVTYKHMFCPKAFKAGGEVSKGEFILFDSSTSKAIPRVREWAQQVTHLFEHVYRGLDFPAGVEDTALFMSGVDPARCFIHAPVMASGLSRGCVDDVLDVWLDAVAVARRVYMAGDDRVLSAVMYFLLPAMFAIDPNKRPRERQHRFLHDRETVRRRVSRWQQDRFVCLPALLREFSELCEDAEASRTKVAPALTMNEQLAKVIMYIQRGDTAKCALDKVNRTEVGPQQVIAAAQQAFPAANPLPRVHPGVGEMDLELLMRPEGETDNPGESVGVPKPFAMPPRPAEDGSDPNSAYKKTKEAMVGVLRKIRLEAAPYTDGLA